VSRGEGEKAAAQMTLAASFFSVSHSVKPVGEPDAGDRHVRFDERGWETGRCRMARATAPILDSAEAADHILICAGRFRGEADKQGRVASTAWVEDDPERSFGSIHATCLSESLTARWKRGIIPPLHE
jgi:hypothetical protein